MTDAARTQGDAPLLESASSARSLWQSYRIYPDHLELLTWTGRWAIPFDDITGCAVAEPLLKSLVHLRLDLRHLPRGIKLDFADFQEHVAIDRASGLVRRILFTPEDPAAFQATLEAAIARHRQSTA